MIGGKELGTRFTWHKPSEKQISRMEVLRSFAGEMAWKILEAVPESREQSLAITKLEESIMWANAGIVRRSD